MVEIVNLSAAYGEALVLRDLSLSISAGQVLVVAGPNGSGKSTLLKTLAGLLPVKNGVVSWNGTSLSDLPQQRLAQTVAYLPQNRSVPEITVLRLVLHGRFPYLSYPRRYRMKDLEIARTALMQMGIADLAERPLASLSGGQRQKAYIAMALAQDTPVVLLDEPTTFLDVSHQLQLMDQARLLAASGKAVVLVLHDLVLALEYADRLAILDHGRLAAWGEPETVFRQGCLDSVFGVVVRRFYINGRWHYYYERGESVL